MTESTYYPKDDGITHINVYSKANTDLGRNLSNFSLCPFELKEEGRFLSIEGYWYWLLCEASQDRDNLRYVYGFKAKELGRKLAGPDRSLTSTLEFRRKIARAISTKIKFHQKLMIQFAESDLPFTHYYVYGNKIVVPEGSDWLLEILVYYRDLFKKKLESKKCQI